MTTLCERISARVIVTPRKHWVQVRLQHFGEERQREIMNALGPTMLNKISNPLGLALFMLTGEFCRSLHWLSNTVTVEVITTNEERKRKMWEFMCNSTEQDSTSIARQNGLEIIDRNPKKLLQNLNNRGVCFYVHGGLCNRRRVARNEYFILKILLHEYGFRVKRKDMLQLVPAFLSAYPRELLVDPYAEFSEAAEELGLSEPELLNLLRHEAWPFSKNPDDFIDADAVAIWLENHRKALQKNKANETRSRRASASLASDAAQLSQILASKLQEKR